jgi:hypothetical protein
VKSRVVVVGDSERRLVRCVWVDILWLEGRGVAGRKGGYIGKGGRGMVSGCHRTVIGGGGWGGGGE